MKIHTILVGFLAESGLPGGHRGGELKVPEGTTLAQVLAQLQVPDEGSWMVTVNGMLPRRSGRRSLQHVLQDGDVIRFVPRIGGG
jgi:sulfur carrier protein ThiS